MYSLFTLSVVLLLIYVNADPRTPKIYNVLISTKKNLSPSHALPVYEPVLRTTSFGIALPSIFYQSPVATYGHNFIGRTQTLDSQNINTQQDDAPIGQPVSLLPVGQFKSYAYSSQLPDNTGYYTPLNDQNRLQPRFQDKFQVAPTLEQHQDPKNVIANLKRNPNIPDVPPPALPRQNM